MALFRRVKPPFSLKTLQKDSNCVAIQDPSAVWGVQDFLPRRNLLTYSEDVSNAAWTKSGMLAFGSGSVSDHTTSPLGSTADLLVPTTSNSVHYVSYAINQTVGVSYNLTVWAKASGYSWCRVYFAGVYVSVNLSTGAVGNKTTGLNVTVTDAGLSFYKIVITHLVATSDSVYLTINNADSSISVSYAGDGTSGIIFGGAQLTRADTIDQSYQKITDWTTEQYAWAAAKQVPWLRRNRFLNTATLSTQTVSSVTANPITVSFKGTGTITFSTAYVGSLVGTGANNRVTATFTPSAGNLVCTVSGTVTEAQCENGSVATDYQPILADWDATYTANAIAAGYPIALWQDSAGTKAVNADNQAIGACRDLKYGDYGPNLVSNGDASNGTTGWTGSVNTTLANASGKLSVTASGSYPKATQPLNLVIGKRYLVTADIEYVDAQAWIMVSSADTMTPDRQFSVVLNSSSTTVSYVFTSTINGGYIGLNVETTTIGKSAKFDNISVREIPGYTAIQATTANQPKWRLDANGKALFERDGVNDAMPITLPTVLSDAQLGPELVVNGGFDSDTGWTKDTGWSISNGVAVGTTVTDWGLKQASNHTIGKTYRMSFDLVTVTSGSIGYVYIGTNIAANRFNCSASSTGRYTGLITPTTAGLLGFYPYSSFSGTIDNVSVKEVIGTNVVYTAEQNVTLKDSGLILSGSYAPITPAADYGRIIMAADSRYDAKIIKYLDGKRGRTYSLGQELLSNGDFSNGTTGWSAAGGTPPTISVVSGELQVTTPAVSGGAGAQQTFTSVVGKVYQVSGNIRTGTATDVRVRANVTAYDGTTLAESVVVSSASPASINFVFTATSTTTAIYLRTLSAGAAVTGYFDNLSVREVILS